MKLLHEKAELVIIGMIFTGGSMDNRFVDHLKAVLPSEAVRFDVPLKDYTTMRVGGPAAVFVEVQNDEQVAATVALANKENIPLLVIGNGSNMIVSDDGFDGVVLYIGKQMGAVRCENERIIAQAGALLPTISRYAAEHALSGLEFAAGIPGSVGGAVVMNAGAYGGEMKQVVESVTVYIDGQVKVLSVDELDYGYRHSALMDEKSVVLSATFKLIPGNKDEILAIMSDLNAKRREKQPLQYPSSGSFFKRPEGHFAGALIQNANLKGVSVGGAQVSELHAGFFINTGKATAHDVYSLMLHVQDTVENQFGVHLQPEVRFIGRFEK